MIRLKQFKDVAFVVGMRESVLRGESLESYKNSYIEYAPNRIEDTDLQIDNLPVLEVRDNSSAISRAADDAENAIKLHSSFASMTREQGTNTRLWTYLTHVTFREYCITRWPTADKDQLSSFIDQRYFYSGSKRIAHNAIARLWWAAELTHAPWDKNEELRGLYSNDPYIFTRVLFAKQDIHTSLVERDLFSSQILFFTVLEYFRINPEASGKSFIQELTKELNLISGYKKIYMLTVEEANELVQKTGDYLAERRNEK